MASSPLAPPSISAPVGYPDRCARDAKPVENVVVAFDTTGRGEAFKFRVAESTNTCFNAAAKAYVREWRHALVSSDKRLWNRQDLRTTLTFNRVKSKSAPERRFRRSVRKRLERIRRDLEADKDPVEALAKLGKIEAKYGGDFSHTERAAFCMLRAIAFHDAGSVEQALMELRTVREIQIEDEVFADLNVSIEQLEMLVNEGHAVTARNNETDDKR